MRFGRTIVLVALGIFAAGAPAARAQQHIGSTVDSQNLVSRELSGASGPLNVGDDVFRSEVVRTGEDSRAKLVFLDSTNLAVGPTSRVTLDEFVYSDSVSAQKVTINLAKGVFRFTTGALDKKAYEIKTPTTSIGVRGTVLDIDSRSAQSRVTLVEGKALVCPRRAGITFEQQVRNCTGDAPHGARCDCVDLAHAGQTALVRRSAGGAIQATPEFDAGRRRRALHRGDLRAGRNTHPPAPARRAAAAFRRARYAASRTRRREAPRPALATAVSPRSPPRQAPRGRTATSWLPAGCRRRRRRLAISMALRTTGDSQIAGQATGLAVLNAASRRRRAVLLDHRRNAPAIQADFGRLRFITPVGERRDGFDDRRGKHRPLCVRHGRERERERDSRLAGQRADVDVTTSGVGATGVLAEAGAS